MCTEADRLRFAWYALANQYGYVALPLSDSIKYDIIVQRGRDDYQQALENLRRHFEECPLCQSQKEHREFVYLASEHSIHD